MIAVDANLLVYAHRSESPFYERASGCVRELAEGRAAWAIPWPCLHEFYGIATHARRYVPPTLPSAAIRQIEFWLASPTLRLIGETPSHWSTLQAMLTASDVKGPLIHDARIAAICAQHGVREFWTADRDFSRFPALRCVNPLVPR